MYLNTHKTLRILQDTAVIFLTGFLMAVHGQSQTLDYYINKGIHNSPLLKDLGFQKKALALDSLKVLAGYGPQAGIGGDLMYPPAIGKFAYDSSITDGGHYAALVRVEKPLFYRKQAAGQLQGVTIQKLMLDNNYKVTEAELREAITAQYITVFTDNSQVKSLKDIIGLLRKQQPGLNLLVEKGLYQKADYLNLSVSIDSRLVGILQAHRQYRNDLAILNILCGIEDTSSVELERPVIPIRKTFDPMSSPSLERYRIDSIRIANEHLVADLAYRPKVTVFADAGINAVNPRRIPYNLGTSLGVSLVMPLYDGHQRELSHSKISLEESTRTVYRDFSQNQFRQRAAQLLEQLTLTDSVLSGMNRQLQDLESLIKVYQTEIEKGMVRWLDFLSAINTYTETRAEAVQVELGRLQILNQLNYLK